MTPWAPLDGRRHRLVVQSAPPDAPEWVRRCIASVRAHAAATRAAHELIGDELFELVDAQLAALLGGARLPLSDLARLALVERRLSEGWREVVWVDADVLVWDGALVDLAVPHGAGLAVVDEVWVTGGAAASVRALRYAANAVVAADDAPAVAALLAAARARASCGGVGERSLGPDLLTPRHRVRPFASVRGVGVLSPMVLADLVTGSSGGLAVAALVEASPHPLGAANLCSSMADAELAASAVDVLLSSGLGAAHGQ